MIARLPSDTGPQTLQTGEEQDTELFIYFAELKDQSRRVMRSYFRDGYIARLTGTSPTDNQFPALEIKKSEILRTRSVLSAFGIDLDRGCYLLFLEKASPVQ